jgi:predicted permease
VSVLAGLTFGLVPALQATRTDLTPALKEGGTLVLRRRGRLTPQTVLLLAQVAGSLMLLLIIGVLALGIQSTLGIQKGFDPKNLYLISIDPVRDGYSGEWAANYFPKLLERIQRLPSVSSASLTDTVPVAINNSPRVTWSSGQTTPGSKVERALKYVVGKDYFETAGIPILAGRGFRKLDESDAASVVIVSETLVRNFWNGGVAVGRSIEISTGDPTPGAGLWPGSFDFHPGALGNGPRVFEIVGVAGDVTNDLVVNRQHPAIYFPLRPADYAEPSLRGITLLLRAAPGSDAIGVARREIAAMEPNITPFDARSMMEQISQFMVPLRSAAWTYGLIGAFGLVLASIGLAGVTAYSVTQRAHEIGVRVALGARKRDVLGMVMRRGLTLVAVGTVIGLMGAWAGIRALSGLFSTVATVSTSEPLLSVGAPLLLASVAVIACYLPARRSMRIDPAITLREE